LNIPEDLQYTESHEWVRIEGETATIGITDHAQDELGDVVFVELPGEGDTFDAGESFGTVESVKAVSDLYAPVGGEVVEVNSALEDAPENINEDPYGEAGSSSSAPRTNPTSSPPKSTSRSWPKSHSLNARSTLPGPACLRHPLYLYVHFADIYKKFLNSLFQSLYKV